MLIMMSFYFGMKDDEPFELGNGLGNASENCGGLFSEKGKGSPWPFVAVMIVESVV